MYGVYMFRDTLVFVLWYTSSFCVLRVCGGLCACMIIDVYVAYTYVFVFFMMLLVAVEYYLDNVLQWKQGVPEGLRGCNGHDA